MKRLLKVVLGSLFTIILLLLAIPLFISADTLKKQVAEQATKATGRQVDIKGKASLTLFPNIEVSVADVTIGNPSGFRSPYLIHAKELGTGAALGPLLSGNLNVTGITLHGADIHLEQLASGAKNWDFAKPGAAAPAPAASGGGASSAIKSFALGDISIKDSAVSYATPAQNIKADEINLTVKGADAHGAFKVNGSVRYQGKPVKLDAKVDKLRDVLGGRASPAALALDLPGGTVKFDGKVQNDQEVAAAGKVAVDISDVAGTVAWATGKPAKQMPKRASVKGDAIVHGKQFALKGADVLVEIPGGTAKFNGDVAMTDAASANGKLDLALSDVPAVSQWATGKANKSLPKSLNLTMAIATKGKVYTLSGLNLKADDVSATGNLTANMTGSVPAIAGALKFGTLDLNTLMKTASAEPSHGFMDAYAAAPSTGWSDAPIDLSALRSANANVTITADALKQGNLEVSNVALHPQLNDGNLTLGIDKATLYGGSANGTINASANGGQSVGANLNFSNIALEPFLTALSGKSNIRGTANMKLNLKGAGASQRAIVSNLNGNGNIAVANGEIKGINFAQFLRDVKKGFMFDNPSRTTDFTALTGTFTVAQGILSNQDLDMKSPALRLSGKGTVDLPRRQVNYRLVPSIVTSVKGQGGEAASGLDVPLNITGSMDNPSIVPDVAGMVQQQLQNPAVLKNTIKDVKETIKQYNSPSDIGKALLGGNKQAAPAAAQPATTTAAPAATEAAPAAATPQAQPQQLTPEQQLLQGLGGLLDKKKK